MNRIILIVLFVMAATIKSFAQETREIIFDYVVEGNDLVFTTEVDPIHSYEERYSVELSYRIIVQDRSTENRDPINIFNRVNFLSNDIPEITSGKSSFRVDINKYLPDLLSAEDNIVNFRIKANLSFIPVELNIKKAYKRGKPITSGVISNEMSANTNKYLDLDPSLRYTYSISSSDDSEILRGNLENVKDLSYSTGPLQKLDPGEYTFSVRSSKYGNDIDSKTITIKNSSPLGYIIAGVVVGGVVYITTKGEKGLPPLPDPPDPN